MFSKYHLLIFSSHWIDQIFGLYKYMELLNPRRAHHKIQNLKNNSERKEIIIDWDIWERLLGEGALDMVLRDSWGFPVVERGQQMLTAWWQHCARLVWTQQRMACPPCRTMRGTCWERNTIRQRLKGHCFGAGMRPAPGGNETPLGALSTTRKTQKSFPLT